MELLNFKTSSGIKSIVGRDLITDKFVAIFELVKNGYDANAKNIIVSFNNIYPKKENSLFPDFEKLQENSLHIDIDEPHIIIADDGHGMNKDDLINKWLYLAYSEKHEGSDNKGRTFVGSKGIGRFSCDTLGEILNIRTKKADENVEHQLFVDWSTFETNLADEFSDIKVSYNSKTTNNNSQYTILTIGKPRHTNWSESDELDRAKKNLERLKNPFIDDNSFNIYLGKNINLENSDPDTKIKNNISEVLKNKTTTIEATIGKHIKIELYDRGELIYRASKQNDSILKYTPVHISINYLNTSAKSSFTRVMKVQPVNYGNIFIYKNDFRVMPYGEEDYDLFSLNLRKTQGFYRYIGTREIIGYISIQDNQHFFKESSSRNNGFIENVYFYALRDIYLKEIHPLLERYILLIKWGEDSATKNEIFFDSKIELNEVDKFKKYISGTKKFEIDYFKDNIEVEINNPEKQLEKIITVIDDKEVKQSVVKVKEQFKELKKDNAEKEVFIEKKEKEIKYLHKQNENLKKARESSSYSEQISHHFKSMAEDLYYSTSDLLKLTENIKDEEEKAKFLVSIAQIRSTQKELSAFRDLLINTNLDMRSNQTINWYEQSKLYSENLKKQSYNLNVNCSISDDIFFDRWNKECDILQFQIALDNFYQNVREQNGNYLDILFEEDKITFSSNSTLIENIHLEKIFELGYSTKPNGTGIGLYQIKEFFKKNQCDISISQDNDTVKFIIEKRI